MSNRDTVTIKKFKIKDLFEVMSSKKIYHAVNVDIKEQQKIGYYPYVVRSEVNRGIRGYIKAPKETLNDANTISFAQDTFIAFYQKQPYFTGNNVKILKPLFKPTEKKLLYIECALNKAIAFNSWGMGSSFEYVENIEIEIPITKNNQPDWEYMENYITEIENKYINKLEQHNNEKIEQALKVIGLSKEVLNEELKVEPAKRYEKFRVGDLFDVKTIKGINNDKLNTDYTQGKYRYITRTSLNNGISSITGLIQNVEIQEKNTFSLGLLGMDFFYQSHPWYAGQFVRKIQPKFSINKNLAIYFSTIFNKRSEYYKGVLIRDFDKKFKNDVLTLPSIDENTPDFEYMEKAIYIYTLDKLFKIGNYLTKKK